MNNANNTVEIKEKNGTASLVIVLVLMMLFILYQFVLVPYVFTKPEKKEEEDITEQTPAEKLAALAAELHEAFSLTYEEESAYSPEDRAALMERLTLFGMSERLKIFYGLKNLDRKFYTKDVGYSKKEALENSDGDFHYNGIYIMTDHVDVQMKGLFGDIPYNHQTIQLNNTRYVYIEAKGMYEEWIRRNPIDHTTRKITHKEVTTTSTEIIILEYIAYTDFKDEENPITRTIHFPSIDVIITEENVVKYLSYMDKYRYTFEKKEDGTYDFKSLEYVRD